MQHLILRPGPELALREFRPQPNDLERRPQEHDVTERAHEFLFEPVTLHADTTLADVFGLIEASPLLKHVHRPAFVEELCAEAGKGAVRDAPQPLHERIEWSVSLTPLRALLAVPVRVNHEVRITEDDQAAQAWMQEIGRAQVEDVTLGQVLEGLLWELSFHGGPGEQEAVAEDLRQRVAEVRGGTAETVSSDDLFERLDVPRCAGMFDDLGGHRPREIGQALHNIGDVENAARWIEQKFVGRVLVKADYRELSGREFRRAYQSVRV